MKKSAPRSTEFFRHALLLNLAVFCIASSGPLGRAVAMQPVLIILWRAGMAFLFFTLLLHWQGLLKQVIPAKDRWLMLGGGVLIAIHWVTYFMALQLSNVAIGMLSLFTYPVITAILEPIILKTRFQWAHLLLGALTVLGIYFLAPSFDIHDQKVQALGWGITSAFIYALRNILMKPLVHLYSGTQIMHHHMLAVFLVLLPATRWLGTGDILGQWPYIVALALITTAVGHTLLLQSFRHFSITTASIFSCVQPIYGILLGAIFLQEYPNWSTYLGGSIILLAVVIESVRVRR